MSWFSVKWRTLGWSTLFLATTSCGLLGPTTIAPARRDYAEAIRISSNRELLSNIVRLRFAAMPEMLDLTQVVTQYSVTAAGSAGATFQSGANEFPLSLHSTLEENPTITYTPVVGEAFAMRLLAPLQPYQLFMLNNAGWNAKILFSTALQGMNGLRNIAVSTGPICKPLPPSFSDFTEALQLIDELETLHTLNIVYWPLTNIEETGSAEKEKGDSHAAANDFTYSLAFLPSKDPSHQKSSARLKTLLGLAQDKNIFPILMRHDSEQPAGSELVIDVRPMLAVMLHVASGIELPDPYAQQYPNCVKGMDRCYHAQSNYHPADTLKIHVTEAPPLEAYVAIQFQDLWFWIELHDTNSKNSFALIQYLTRLQQARGSLPNAGVLLTIPTS
jgi:hypothetical protein